MCWVSEFQLPTYILQILILLKHYKKNKLLYLIHISITSDFTSEVSFHIIYMRPINPYFKHSKALETSLLWYQHIALISQYSLGPIKNAVPYL